MSTPTIVGITIGVLLGLVVLYEAFHVFVLERNFGFSKKSETNTPSEPLGDTKPAFDPAKFVVDDPDSGQPPVEFQNTTGPFVQTEASNIPENHSEK